MRDFDQAVTALAVALGFSPKHTEAHAKLLCRGDDTNAGQVVLIIKVRVQPRRMPLTSRQEKGPPSAGKGTKGPGNPRTPRNGRRHDCRAPVAAASGRERCRGAASPGARPSTTLAR
jgi:hypothetical protein